MQPGGGGDETGQASAAAQTRLKLWGMERSGAPVQVRKRPERVHDEYLTRPHTSISLPWCGAGTSDVPRKPQPLCYAMPGALARPGGAHSTERWAPGAGIFAGHAEPSPSGASRQHQHQQAAALRSTWRKGGDHPFGAHKWEVMRCVERGNGAETSTSSAPQAHVLRGF